jgi:hypothetical protein
MDFSSLSEQSLRTSRLYLRARNLLMIRTGHLGGKSPTDAGLGKSCAMTMQKASTSMGRGKGYCPFPGPHPQNQQQQQNQDHEQNQGRLHRRLDTLLKNAHTVE